ncbi:sulfite exporter TauE/SafE family protein [Arcobacter sp. FWKO B]|uniref:sulfite exporter TauE/SafE family protein n=1 Tax=Arcobacter sp. FWKO B TaxID=2593672 RepID=UPI0018A60FDC|nr:sulfite exporter TauE/SafE family protein [Arcobacter sp. FWKO B]QOG11860.1 sulfite exporter TauE/SafE family protein [Arcobacter sp. FWKO B]
METISILSIITIAFLGSFGHCIGMCGGIVMAYSSIKIDDEFNKLRQTFAHLSYSVGRVLTYVLLGVLFGFLGGVIAFSNMTNGILLLVAGTFMVLAGLSLFGKIKFLTMIEHSVSKSSWYQKSFKSLLHSSSLFSFFLLGMLNGLLPCGFVYFFAITAASTADPFWGGVVMLIFGLSTIPAMFSLGFFVGLFKQSGFRNIMIKFASIAVILFGIYTLYSGYEYIVNPNKTILDCHL